MELHLKAVEGVDIRPDYNNRLTVVCEGVSEENLLEQLKIDDVISFFGEEALLDKIGQDKAIEHFQLGPEEEG